MSMCVCVHKWICVYVKEEHGGGSVCCVCDVGSQSTMSTILTHWTVFICCDALWLLSVSIAN